MQAIRTRYHGPTNVRGSRIIAKCGGGSVPYNHALNLDGNHAAAAQLLLQRMGWPGVYHGGQFEHDYFWVVPERGDSVSATIDGEQVAA